MKEDTFQQHPDTSLPAVDSLVAKSKNVPFSMLYTKRLCYIASGMCFLSELIHLRLLPEQYEAFIGNGIIFLLIAMVQGIIGANLLCEPRRRLLTFGLWVNLLIILLYVFTHTIGVPVGLAFLLQPIDLWGIGATIAGTIVAILLFLFGVVCLI